ncbi:MAG: hypothetical protein JEZ00_17850 [Anaerolineaceae bacterium]|nr:hypothetical protein [Anaerolineaceae bacterium]
MNTNEYKQTSNRKIAIGSMLIGFGICLFGLILFFVLAKVSQENTNGVVSAKLGIVPYIEPSKTLPATITPNEPTMEVIDGIQQGSAVQIFGTEGAGLKIRNNPGIASVQKFIALDSEVYEVIGGPNRMDGYVWWELSSPYDDERSGWAVSQYLTRIQ